MKIFILILIVLALFRIVSQEKTTIEGKTVRLSGVLQNEPREYGADMLVSLKGYSFFIPRDPDIQYGSTVVVQGIVEETSLKNVSVISITKPTSFIALFRTHVLKGITTAMPEPESALFAGMTIGAPNIPSVFLDALRATGTSHVVVASGGNLAILAGFLEQVLSRFMKRKLFLPLIALVLLFYTALVGFGAPVTRALVMWLLIMLAQLSGRPAGSVYIFFLTILIMLIYKPVWLSDISFQLSIGATGGILFLNQFLLKRLKRIPLISEALSTSVAAQVGTLPVSLLVFKEVKLLAPFWNVLILWTVPYITVIGIIGSAVSLLSLTVAKFIFFASYPFAWYFVRVIQFGG